MNCLIAQNGVLTDCSYGRDHHTVCRQTLHTTLPAYLKAGGVRVKVRENIMAVEFYQVMTDKQNRIVNKLLKEQPIYQLVLAFKIITKHRPIRSFVFDESTLPRK